MRRRNRIHPIRTADITDLATRISGRSCGAITASGDKAHGLLAQAAVGSPKALNTLDLKEAKTLLDELS